MLGRGDETVETACGKKFGGIGATKLSQRRSCFVCTRVLSLKHVALSCGLRGSILPIKVSGSNFHVHLRYEHCCCGMMTRFRTLQPAMLGRVAQPIFTSLCPGHRLRVWVCWGSKSETAWEPLAISRPSLRGPQLTKRCWCIGIAQKSFRHLRVWNPMHRARQWETCTNGHEKPLAWFHWTFLFFVNLADLAHGDETVETTCEKVLGGIGGTKLSRRKSCFEAVSQMCNFPRVAAPTEQWRCSTGPPISPRLPRKTRMNFGTVFTKECAPLHPKKTCWTKLNVQNNVAF